MRTRPRVSSAKIAFLLAKFLGYKLFSHPLLFLAFLATLESVIDVGQGINVGPGKLGKKNKRRALNTHVLCSE